MHTRSNTLRMTFAATEKWFRKQSEILDGHSPTRPRIYEARLLTAPGAWVHLVTTDGVRLSIPAENVLQIEDRR